MADLLRHRITRRQFQPNLQKVHVTTANGTHKTMQVCVQCIRSGAVKKTIRRAPFQLSVADAAVVSKAGKKAKKK